MIDFGLRNLTLFLKDKTAVLLSFLAEFIIVILYILFIRDNLISGFTQLKEPELLMDTWMMAGLLGVTSVTTTMGAYGIMVDDKAKKIFPDFTVSPIRRVSLLGGYMFSAVIVGIIMSFLLLFLSEVYMSWCYGVKPGADRIADLYIVLFLITVSNSALVLFLVSFIKSSNALAACCTILGALIGFLTGIYLPMGSLPESVQKLIKCFPVSHSAVLLRQILMEPYVSRNFSGLENASARQFMEYMGVQYFNEKDPISAQSSIFFLLISAFIFTLAALLRFSQTTKE